MAQKSERDELYERRTQLSQAFQAYEAEHRRVATGGPAQPTDIGEDGFTKLKAEIEEIDRRLVALETDPNAKT